MGDAPASSIPLAVIGLIRIASMGGGRGISLITQPRGALGAQGKPFEIFAKNMFAGSLGALSAHVDEAWIKTFSWLGSDNAPPDFMVRNGDAVEVKVHSGIGQIQLNSSPPKRTLKVDDPRIENGCRECETWVEKDFVYFIGKANREYVEALWVIDGHCIADTASTYDLLFGKLSIVVTDFGGQPGNEIGRLNNVDPLKATSLRIRAMWLLKHPARVFGDLFVAPQNGSFVLNVLMSADKWNAYPEELIHEIESLASIGVSINRVDLRDSGGSSIPLKAVHVSWIVGIS